MDQPSLVRVVKDDQLSHLWLKSAVLFFFIAAVLGTMMRYFYIAEIPFLDYKHILHAHSHVALLGWGYMFVSGAMLFLLQQKSQQTRTLRFLLTVNIVATIGVVAFFLYQGYGPYSIAFSTLHLASVYVFAISFLRNLDESNQNSHTRFIRWSVYWLLVSTLGLWAIAPISALLGKLHPLYYMSIQFFLHFQFNGWFTYAIIGLWIYHFSKGEKTIQVPGYVFWLLQLSLLLTYALSVTWSTPISVIFYLNTAGVLINAIAFFLIFREIFKVSNPFTQLIHWTDWLLAFGVLCLIVKVIVQMAVAIPAVATISYTIRNYVIGFIHLIMLGSITLTGASLLLKNGLLPANKGSKIGWMIIVAGFLGTEIILFGQGTLLWMKKGFIDYYHELLFVITALLPAGIGLVLGAYRRSDKRKTTME